MVTHERSMWDIRVQRQLWKHFRRADTPYWQCSREVLYTHMVHRNTELLHRVTHKQCVRYSGTKTVGKHFSRTDTPYWHCSREVLYTHTVHRNKAAIKHRTTQYTQLLYTMTQNKQTGKQIYKKSKNLYLQKLQWPPYYRGQHWTLL